MSDSLYVGFKLQEHAVLCLYDNLKSAVLLPVFGVFQSF